MKNHSIFVVNFLTVHNTLHQATKRVWYTLAEIVLFLANVHHLRHPRTTIVYADMSRG
jgi:hypothetical protein